MQHQELARHLSVNPTEIVYAVTMEQTEKVLLKNYYVLNSGEKTLNFEYRFQSSA